MRAIATGLGLMLIWPAAHSWAQQHDDGTILTLADLATLERENAMWRMTRVEENVDENLRRLRAAGFTVEEVNALRPRLREIWEIELPREFGWLPEETIERIKAVDGEFVIRLRAVRRFEATGVRAGNKGPEDVRSMNRAWQRALMRALDVRDVAEFRLMNSVSAQTVHKLAKGISLTTGERRVLCHWQREFDGTYGAEIKFSDRFKQAEFKAAQLDHWDRFRQLLGDQRFATYLSNADSTFDQTSRALSQIEHRNPTETLEVWFIRQKYEIARVHTSGRNGRETIMTDVIEKMNALLGPKTFSAYRGTEGAEWLN